MLYPEESTANRLTHWYVVTPAGRPPVRDALAIFMTEESSDESHNSLPIRQRCQVPNSKFCNRFDASILEAQFSAENSIYQGVLSDRFSAETLLFKMYRFKIFPRIFALLSPKTVSSVLWRS